jgi:hypothetical protein
MDSNPNCPVLRATGFCPLMMIICTCLFTSGNMSYHPHSYAALCTSSLWNHNGGNKPETWYNFPCQYRYDWCGCTRRPMHRDHIVRPHLLYSASSPYLWENTSYVTESHHIRLVPYKCLPKRWNLNSAKAFSILTYFQKMKVGLPNHQSLCVSPVNNFWAAW